MTHLYTVIDRVVEHAPDEDAVESLVYLYLSAKEKAEEQEWVMKQAKKGLQTVIDRTGISQWDTPTGKIMVPAPATIVRYDAHALDRIRELSKTVNRYILPHRFEDIRNPGIRILKK